LRSVGTFVNQGVHKEESPCTLIRYFVTYGLRHLGLLPQSGHHKFVYFKLMSNEVQTWFCYDTPSMSLLRKTIFSTNIIFFSWPVKSRINIYFSTINSFISSVVFVYLKWDSEQQFEILVSKWNFCRWIYLISNEHMLSNCLGQKKIMIFVSRSKSLYSYTVFVFDRLSFAL
jgi:hypothetical protein